MNFKEILANYVLGNLPKSQFHQIGLIGLREGLKSNSLELLADLVEEKELQALQVHLNQAMLDLKIALPNKLDAAIILIDYYLKEMIANPSSIFEVMVKIEAEIYNRIEWDKIEQNWAQYLGKKPGFEKLYFWYGEIYDWKKDIELDYGGHYPTGEKRLRFEEELVKTAKELME